MASVWIGAHPTNFSAARPGAWRPEAIVIHVMDGSLAGTDAWFNDPSSKVSAHYGVGKDGVVHQYVKEVDTAYHAGTVVDPAWTKIRKDAQGRFINPNFYTIGIEHAGWGVSTDPWPDAQRQASLQLARDIAERWGIPLDAEHVIPHRLIRSSKPNCPGKGLDFGLYLQDLQSTPTTLSAPVIDERPLSATVRAVTTLNVRSQPFATGVPRRKLLAGDEFVAVAVATGEPHGANDKWYRNENTEYVWAGGTDHPLPA
jgi:N-acetylmuramoyl-L-alanine amidase